MTRIILTFATAGAALLVSCEPLPVYPQQDPYGRGQRAPSQYDPYQDNRYGPPPVGQPQQNPRIAPAPPQQEEYPLAERTDNPNRVLSPYPPYNVIDVQGFSSGQLAKDPSNGKIFRIP